MDMRTTFALLLLLATVASLAACGNDPEPAAVEVDPRSLFVLLQGGPDDEDTRLYLIKGMTGLIEHGDDLMVMVYGPRSHEAEIREWNILKSRSSLSRWLEMGRGGTTVLGGRFLKVPDLDDESGSRFYYFERDQRGAWQFRAICAGAWDDAPAWPSTCDFTYRFGQKTVSIDIEEPLFLRSPDAIINRVLAALLQEEIIEKPVGKGGETKSGSDSNNTTGH
jgi:hypothetical protein